MGQSATRGFLSFEQSQKLKEGAIHESLHFSHLPTMPERFYRQFKARSHICRTDTEPHMGGNHSVSVTDPVAERWAKLNSMVFDDN
jgi:hypothetical protein